MTSAHLITGYATVRQERPAVAVQVVKTVWYLVTDLPLHAEDLPLLLLLGIVSLCQRGKHALSHLA